VTSPTHRAAPSETFEHMIDATLLIGVATAAAVFSWHNVLQLAEDHGQKEWLAWVIAGCIETTAIKGGLEYRRRHRLGQPVVFAVALVTVAAGLQLAAQVAEVDPKFGPWGYILAAVPAATFLTLVKVAASRSGTPAGPLVAALARADEAERVAKAAADDRAAVVAAAAQEVVEARRAMEEEARRRASVEALLAAERAQKPEPLPGKDAPKAAPSREQARAILLDLDSQDAKSNADLAREYGGSDVFWGKRKKDLREELAKLGAEAGNL
jgi:hypothetical protein